MWKVERVVKKGKYLYAVVPEHPKAIRCGYVLLHRVVMENHLERLLNDDEDVHHKNGDGLDNRVENLEVLTKSQHKRLHNLSRSRKWIRLKCPSCNALFDRQQRQTHVAKGGVYTACSRSCSGKIRRELALRRETAKMKDAISANIVSEYRKYWTDDNAEETQGNEVP